jgi:hypothetical protein
MQAVFFNEDDGTVILRTSRKGEWLESDVSIELGTWR